MRLANGPSHPGSDGFELLAISALTTGNCWTAIGMPSECAYRDGAVGAADFNSPAPSLWLVTVSRVVELSRLPAGLVAAQSPALSADDCDWPAPQPVSSADPRRTPIVRRTGCP